MSILFSLSVISTLMGWVGGGGGSTAFSNNDAKKKKLFTSIFIKIYFCDIGKITLR